MTSYLKKKPRAHVAVPKGVRDELDASRSPLTNREKRLVKAESMLKKRTAAKRDLAHAKAPKETRAQKVKRFRAGKMSPKERKAMSVALGDAGERGELSKDYYAKIVKGLGVTGPEGDKVAETQYGESQKRKASYDKRINPHTGKRIGMEGQGMPGSHRDMRTGETYRADLQGKEIPGSRHGVKHDYLKPKHKLKPKLRPKPKGGPHPVKGKGPRRGEPGYKPTAFDKGPTPVFGPNWEGGPWRGNRHGGKVVRAGGRRRRPRFPGGPSKGYASFHRPHKRARRIYAR